MEIYLRFMLGEVKPWISHKSLITENLVEANQETKRDERFGREREIEGCVCLCLCQGVSDNERGRAEIFLSEWMGEMKFYVGKEKIFAEI